MPKYKAPLRDYKFVMQEMLNCENHYLTLGYEDATTDMVDAILSEAAKFTEQVIAPINQIGDQQGCQWDLGTVTTPDGFKEAYSQYVEGGWPTLAQDKEIGGQGLPHSLNTVVSEMFSAANHSFAMYPGLSHGCISTIERYASDKQKNMFLPKLVEGTWTGTMCLTEAHCGTDLGLLRTKAELNEDGSYRLNGSKIFISAGEHDLSENIVHIVIARIPGSPEGTKGISLFVVPKFNINEEGEIVARNGVNCGSIEHKMGIHGNSTCVINFDDAKGYLIGEVNKGLRCMFTFMNGARLGVANEGVSASEAAFQGSLAYAKERLQMRSMTGNKNPDGPADPIIVHPDVRKMLLTQKSFAEGGRAMVAELAHLVDNTYSSKDPKVLAVTESKLALLTPIAKAFLTETGLESANHGIQVFGGHGFIQEWGMEQLVRDTRICCLYEGTTGIQALDLLGRKVIGSQGELLEIYLNEIEDFLTTMDEASMPKPCATLQQYVNQWRELTESISVKAQESADEIGAASVDYLMFSGYVCLAYYWLKMMLTAKSKLENNISDSEFYQAKINTGKFYFDRVLPRAKGHAACIDAGAESMMQLDPEHFSF